MKIAKKRHLKTKPRSIPTTRSLKVEKKFRRVTEKSFQENKWEIRTT